jgi:hypothetical protein
VVHERGFRFSNGGATTFFSSQLARKSFAMKLFKLE